MEYDIKRLGTRTSTLASTGTGRRDQWRQSGFKSGGRGSESKKFDFSRQISENFRFFQKISKKITIRQFQKNFALPKIGHLQLLLGKLFYFSSKVTTFEHTSCTVHDKI